MMNQAMLKAGAIKEPADLSMFNINANLVFPRQQDTKFELVQPIFNMNIVYANKAAGAQERAAGYEYLRKELDVTYQIKEAYYNYLKSLQLMDIRKSALELASQNRKVIQSLFDVDKAPKSDVLRADVLLSTTRQDIQSSQSMATMARNYFNNILNSAFDSEVKYDTVTIEDLAKPENKDYLKMSMPLDEAVSIAIASRPELKQMEESLNALRHVKNLANADMYPSLALVADYGIQGEKYSIDDQSRYWMVSGVFSWNLFSGFETKAKSQEAQYQIEALEKSMESIRQLIRLDVQNNYIDYNNNMDQLAVAETTFRSAEENYRMNHRRYEEGLEPLISLIDAQTTLTGAKANYVVTYYNILNAKARLEKSLGTSISRLTTENE
jgi:outer membrane protein TolC